MKVAAVNWKIRQIENEQGFFDHLSEMLDACVAEDCDLVVLPELPVLELLSLRPDLPEAEGPAWLSAFAPAYEAALIKASVDNHMTIIGGSHFSPTSDGFPTPTSGQFFNVSAITFPNGWIRLQPKVKLTTYEREVWRLEPGPRLRLLPEAKVGVTICYDAEFPESGRKLAEGGVLIQCVPAFTETIYGFQRVRWSCRARAIENQVFVIHSSLVGDLGREPVPATYGSSAILCPSCEPFASDAFLDETPFNEEAIAIEELDFDLLDEARNGGDVRNWHDREPAW